MILIVADAGPLIGISPVSRLHLLQQLHGTLRLLDNRPIQCNMEISVSAGQVIRTGKVGMMLQRD